MVFSWKKFRIWLNLRIKVFFYIGYRVRTCGFLLQNLIKDFATHLLILIYSYPTKSHKFSFLPDFFLWNYKISINRSTTRVKCTKHVQATSNWCQFEGQRKHKENVNHTVWKFLQEIPSACFSSLFNMLLISLALTYREIAWKP